MGDPNYPDGRRKWDAPSWFQQRYRSIKQRCTKSDSKYYKNYGGRGICIEFVDVDAMWKHMKSLPDCSKYLTIDRADNNKNYAVGNLRWVSSFVQNTNRRRTAEGIRRVNGSPRFQARITKYSKEIYLGTYETYELAEQAVLAAKNKRSRDYE
jgi:hypothetical protein